MSKAHPGFRIFVLGAGFSRLAGLPLGTELFDEVRRRIDCTYGTSTKFHRDLDAYIEYRLKCDGRRLNVSDIDFEDFMSYLDIEHFLGLRGKDTWNREGNESQLLIREFVGQLIHERTPQKGRLPTAYYEFARRLATNDTVVTFNYDIVLERALEEVGKPYRLFQNRFKSIGLFSNEVDNDRDEVVLLKMHGSVDWFNKAQYNESLEVARQSRLGYKPKHAVFAAPCRFTTRCLVDGPRNQNDPLLDVYRIENVDDFYATGDPLEPPFILSPSYVKFVYAPPIFDFWYGLARGGAWNLGLCFVGYSLPTHDEYIRIALYNLAANYQRSGWNERLLDTVKDNVKLVDFRCTSGERDEFRDRYRFLDQSKASYYWDGFSDGAIDFIFSQHR